MRKLKAVIVDDERLARQRIQRLVSQEPDVEVVGQCASVYEARDVLAQGMPDLLFVDVQMPRANGFELLKAAEGGSAPAVIFITAYEQYAVQAFEVQACDYLLKPVEEGRLKAAVQKARDMLGRRDVENAADALLIRSGTKVSRLRIEAIDWIEAAGNYVYLHSGREAHLMRETIAAFEARLPGSRFVRIHRTTIVNLDRVVEFHPSFSGDFFVLMEGGKQLRLSRTYRGRVRDLFGRSI